MTEQNPPSESNDPTGFQPYIPAERVTAEFTLKALIIGMLLAALMLASNAYLGMRAGITVTASIPAAVISMSIFYGLRKTGMQATILENNIVQTITSAGESLAAGVIFTVVGVVFLDQPLKYWEMTIPALIGGFLGVLFMIPMRRYLMVKQHAVLPYPEGTACADVLKAGERGGIGALLIFLSLVFGIIYTFLEQIWGFFRSTLEGAFRIGEIRGFAFGGEFTPALFGVGYIIGPKISAFIFAGGISSWLILIPILVMGGFAPEGETMWEQAESVWNSYIRYVGAGAMLVGGIYRLIQMRSTIGEALGSVRDELGAKARVIRARTDRDLPMLVVVCGAIVCVILITIIPTIPIGFIGGVIATIAAFLFVAVSSYIVGIVGSSSNPISGMTIATILVAALIMKMGGVSDPVVVLLTAAVVCVAAAIAGDTAQDLKTGYLLGATPARQQIGEMVGVCVAAFLVGTVIFMLHNTYGIGQPGSPLIAPQAGMMALISKAVLTGAAKWGFIFIGGIFALILILMGIPVLPFAVGLYLPVTLGTPIMLGGAVRWIVDKVQDLKRASETEREGIVYRGRVVAAGLIAGEALGGLLIACLMLPPFSMTGILDDYQLGLSVGWLESLGVIAIAAMILFQIYFTILAFRGRRVNEGL